MNCDLLSVGPDEKIVDRHVKHEAKGSTRHVGKVILSDCSESCAMPGYLEVSLEKRMCNCFSESRLIHVQEARDYDTYPFKDELWGTNIMKVYEFLVGSCVVESVVVWAAVSMSASEIACESEVRDQFEAFLLAFAALVKLVKASPHNIDEDDMSQDELVWMLKFRVYHSWADIIASEKARSALKRSGVELDNYDCDSAVGVLYREFREYSNEEFAQALVLVTVLCPLLDAGCLGIASSSRGSSWNLRGLAIAGLSRGWSWDLDHECRFTLLGGLAIAGLSREWSWDLECRFTLHVRERIDLFCFRFESLIELIVDNLGSGQDNIDLIDMDEVDDMADKVTSAWRLIALCSETREALIDLGCDGDVFLDCLESDSEDPECGDLDFGELGGGEERENRHGYQLPKKSLQGHAILDSGAWQNAYGDVVQIAGVKGGDIFVDRVPGQGSTGSTEVPGQGSTGFDVRIAGVKEEDPFEDMVPGQGADVRNPIIALGIAENERKCKCWLPPEEKKERRAGSLRRNATEHRDACDLTCEMLLDVEESEFCCGIVSYLSEAHGDVSVPMSNARDIPRLGFVGTKENITNNFHLGLLGEPAGVVKDEAPSLCTVVFYVEIFPVGIEVLNRVIRFYIAVIKEDVTNDLRRSKFGQEALGHALSMYSCKIVLCDGPVGRERSEIKITCMCLVVVALSEPDVICSLDKISCRNYSAVVWQPRVDCSQELKNGGVLVQIPGAPDLKWLGHLCEWWLYQSGVGSKSCRFDYLDVCDLGPQGMVDRSEKEALVCSKNNHRADLKVRSGVICYYQKERQTALCLLFGSLSSTTSLIDVCSSAEHINCGISFDPGGMGDRLCGLSEVECLINCFHSAVMREGATVTRGCATLSFSLRSCLVINLNHARAFQSVNNCAIQQGVARSPVCCPWSILRFCLFSSAIPIVLTAVLTYTSCRRGKEGERTRENLSQKNFLESLWCEFYPSSLVWRPLTARGVLVLGWSRTDRFSHNGRRRDSSTARGVCEPESSEGRGVERLLTTCYGEIFIAISLDEPCELLMWHRALVPQRVSIDYQFDLLMQCVMFHATVGNSKRQCLSNSVDLGIRLMPGERVLQRQPVGIRCGLLYILYRRRKEGGITPENFDFYRDSNVFDREFCIINDVNLGIQFDRELEMSVHVCGVERLRTTCDGKVCIDVPIDEPCELLRWRPKVVGAKRLYVRVHGAHRVFDPGGDGC